MEYKCPKCGSVIYSRRNVLCGVCGERLPDELLFSASERAVVERDLAEAKRRLRLAGDSVSPSTNIGDSSDGGGFSLGGDAGGHCGGGNDCGGGAD